MRTGESDNKGGHTLKARESESKKEFLKEKKERII